MNIIKGLDSMGFINKFDSMVINFLKILERHV